MINNWLRLTNPSEVCGDLPFSDTQLGSKVYFFGQTGSFREDTQFALISSNQQAASIKKRLYRMSAHPGLRPIVDLGTLVNIKSSTLTPVLRELDEAGIIPILLGISQNDITHILLALSKVKNQRIRPVFVDDKIGIGQDFTRSYLNPILEQEEITVDSISILSFQQHYSNIEQVRIKFPFVHGLRLGTLRNDIKTAEPYVRDANALFFLFNALKHAEAPAQLASNPSGLYSEEACQLTKYAGINESMEFFALGNFDLQYDEHGQTAELTAQMIWYFIFGHQNRANEALTSTNRNLTKYMVNPDDLDVGFIFYKSEKTGRWWVSRQEASKSPRVTNKIYACSYEDYQMCTHNEISERLLELFQNAL